MAKHVYPHAVAFGAKEMAAAGTSPQVWSSDAAWLALARPGGGKPVWEPCTLTLYASGLLVATIAGKRLAWAVRMLEPGRKLWLHLGVVQVRGVAEFDGAVVGAKFHKDNVFVMVRRLGASKGLESALAQLRAPGS